MKSKKERVFEHISTLTPKILVYPGPIGVLLGIEQMEVADIFFKVCALETFTFCTVPVENGVYMEDKSLYHQYNLT